MRRRDPRLSAVPFAIVTCVLSASCERAPAVVKSDASAGGAFGALADAAAPVPPTTTCADATCPEPPGGAPLDERACCLSGGGCGLEARALLSACLPPGGAGSVDPSCPPVVLPDGTSLAGCCAPDGRCGTFDRLGDLGCIPSASSPDATAACRYSPTARCLGVVSLPCDGPEDCGPGDVCCGRSSHGAYDAFGCFPSCAVKSQQERAVWVELCHPETGCRDPRSRCSGSDSLPRFLARCTATRLLEDASTADAEPSRRPDAAAVAAAPDAAPPDRSGIVCGALRCGGSGGGSGTEKCCLRDPEVPYCAPASVSCACVPEPITSEAGEAGGASEASGTRHDAASAG